MAWGRSQCWEGLRDKVGVVLRQERSPRAVPSPIPVTLVPHIMGSLGICCCRVPGWMHRTLPRGGWQSSHRDIRAARPDSSRGSSVQHQLMSVPSEGHVESLWECPQLSPLLSSLPREALTPTRCAGPCSSLGDASAGTTPAVLWAVSTAANSMPRHLERRPVHGAQSASPCSAWDNSPEPFPGRAWRPQS